MNALIRFLAIAGLAVALASPLDARTFTYINGRKAEAELVSLVGNQVTIRVAGRPFVLPITMFSPDDQKFIRESAGGASPTTPAAAPTPATPALTAKLTRPVPTPAMPGTKPAAPGAADERVKPGATFFIEFPKLTVDRHGEPTKMQVRIPAGYDPAKKYPLIVWMGGSDGGNTTGSGPSLVDDTLFVCAGLPFPKGANNASQSNMVGDFKKIWAYHKPMLEELHRVVPNLDTRLRIVSGFSNGAHCIDGLLDDARDYTDWFNCFILVEGGGRAGRWPRKDNQFACVLWGEKSSNKQSGAGENGAHLAKRAKMTVMSEEMKGVGHAFAPEYQPKVREWIEKIVIPAALGGKKG